MAKMKVVVKKSIEDKICDSASKLRGRLLYLFTVFILLVSCTMRSDKSFKTVKEQHDSLGNEVNNNDPNNDSINEMDSIFKLDTITFDSNTIDIFERVTRIPELRIALKYWVRENLQKARVRNKNYYPESIVLGHLEEDTIIGKFDGKHIDTLYVASEECGCRDSPFCKHAEELERTKFYLVSKSGRFPKLRLLAADSQSPRIVNEGDLDGNGTCEIGYMYTWINSQWRCYRIITWLHNKWVYLIAPNEEYMETSLLFRLTGEEVAEPGKKKGTVLIHTLPNFNDKEFTDTIVKPSFTLIDDL